MQNDYTPQGKFIMRNNQKYYQISHAETLKPFFIQVASPNNMWIFMSSKGGITAGRENAANNLFSYETDDRLHSNYDTGSRTYIRTQGKLWQPFAQNGCEQFNISQNIYKSYYGNSVIMEEVNEDLQLTFSYAYENSELYGLVKTSNLVNNSNASIEVEVLDGLMNILPHGVDADLQATFSTLVDAYKASELLGERLAVYSMTTKINDTPNPIEILKANVAFHTFAKGSVYLTPDAITAFANNTLSELNQECYGKKSAYFITYQHTLSACETLEYSFVLDAGLDHSDLQARHAFVEAKKFDAIFTDISRGTQELLDIVASADGLQETADETATAHHFLNTLYNVMRGGTFEHGYNLDPKDFLQFAEIRNQTIHQYPDILCKVKKCNTIIELKEVCASNPLFYRLSLEYLPLSFSRRHGDPSRPWNRFNIKLKNDQGEKITSYEGNWRDIFQNWEALGLSYPYYYENMVAKFVNATTADGFNPYRINQEGIDWEKPEPENPFAGYGYWGDHQIIYLLRLLQGLQGHFPDKLKEMLSLDIFSYANVPYILKSYEEILKDSKDTITFDFKKDDAIEALVDKVGSDGKLLFQNEAVYTVCLTEKLLVPLLSKISNLLVGGGIWMNTQRPEWNDANNAIVGIGLSMVTVYHVKAYTSFLQQVFAKETGHFEVSDTVVQWFQDTCTTLQKYHNQYEHNEKTILDELGTAFSKYRNIVYNKEFQGKSSLEVVDICKYLEYVASAIDYTIHTNSGTVYATYNLLNDDFSVSPMVSMLEGQSAVIGSGMLSASEVCSLFQSMEQDLYQEHLKCHTLYPIHMTKKFADKNSLSKFKEELKGIVVKDTNGNTHFHSSIVTSNILQEKCAKLGVQPEITKALQEEYENLFGHKKFTGRSQVMYKFEGIGCVYWHQNAKLALAVLETVRRTRENGENATEIYALYRKLMSGFIYRKSPEECNAIPMEPYSHTSFNASSEQAGMTGQVKESVIMRRGELGISVKNGEIHFDKWFIPESEFQEDGTLSATMYSIPVVYKKSSSTTVDSICVQYQDGKTETINETFLPKAISQEVFQRSTTIVKITFLFS
ncbi:MAG: hypothetical protein R3Y54_07045 [Eubacteriales bacterium]